MKNRKKKGVEAIRARYGLLFISPWIIGMALFFVYPILQSFYFSFADLSITEEGVATSFVGTAHYHDILFVNPEYTDNFVLALKDFFISLPFILVVSLVVALLLNSKFRGRLFFRTLYFLPVILASGIVLELFLNAADNNATQVAASSEATFGMIDFTEVLKGMRLPETIEKYLSIVLSNVFMMVWQSGIQIVLFIAGLQSIPDQLYEVSKVEGATKWEEFWFITLPMLLRTILLVVIFTIVELVTSNTNPAVMQGYNQFTNLEYGAGSAMLWFYFVFIGLFIALFLLVYNKAFLKRWG